MGSAHWLTKTEQVPLAVSEPRPSLADSLAGIIPCDVGDAVYRLETGRVVFLEYDATCPERGDRGLDVIDLQRHLRVGTRRGTCGLEQGEEASTTPVAKPSRPHLDGLQPKLFGIERPCAVEIFRRKSRRHVSLREHRAAPVRAVVPLSRVHEAAFRRFVWHRPAEVHLDIDDVLVPNGKNLGVPKSLTVRIASLVRDEHAVSIGHEIDKVEPLNDLAVWPAPAEVRLPVEPIIERAREM